MNKKHGFDFTFMSSESKSVNSQPGKIDPQEPMRIVVIADFSANEHESSGVEQTTIRRVDIDNFDDILERKSPTFSIGVKEHASDQLTVSISEMDDFHPDQLYHSQPIFGELRQIRTELQNHATFEVAARKLLALSGDADTPEPTTTDAHIQSSVSGDGDMLASPDTVVAQKTAGLPDGLLQSAVSAHVLPSTSPMQATYLAAIDEAISLTMRHILSDPRFRSIKARWRALEFLLRNIDDEHTVEFYLWDVSRSQIELGLISSGESDSLSHAQTLLTSVAGEDGCSILVTDLFFSNTDQDLTTLAALGSLAEHNGAVLLANAASERSVESNIPGSNCELALDKTSESEASGVWNDLRSHSLATYIGLSAPRFLLRMPYGLKRDPIDAFNFEEIPSANSHESYFWAPSSFYITGLLASSFVATGWSGLQGGRLNEQLEFSDLPAVVVTSNGEASLLPCAELLLSESNAAQWQQKGVMPLLSYQKRNAARLMAFQSISHPVKALNGRWCR